MMPVTEVNLGCLKCAVDKSCGKYEAYVQDKLGEFPTIPHQGIFHNLPGSLENLCAFPLKFS